MRNFHGPHDGLFVRMLNYWTWLNLSALKILLMLLAFGFVVAVLERMRVALSTDPDAAAAQHDSAVLVYLAIGAALVAVWGIRRHLEQRRIRANALMVATRVAMDEASDDSDDGREM